MRGDEYISYISYISGAGWRTEYPDYGAPQPSSDALTAADTQRCNAALCVPACPGATRPSFTLCDAGADAGMADGGGD